MRAATLAGLTLAWAAGLAAQDAPARLSGAALINHHVKVKWDELGLKPARRADDAEFMRRVHLDVVGVIPSLEEADGFLADKSPDKRSQLVDALLKDPGYAAHWADVWTGILVGFDSEMRELVFRLKATEDLRQMFAQNLPYDEFARRVINIKGIVYQNFQKGMVAAETPDETGLANYLYKLFLDAGRQDFPKALAGKLTRAFMGVQIACAQCHDHPFDKWTQEEFYGMASFFTELTLRRVEAKPASPDAKRTPANGYYYFQIEDRNLPAGPMARRMMGGGDLSIPDSKGPPIKAAFLENGKGVTPGSPRREQFGKLMTSKENLQFAKMAVNRLWGHFMGAGIVDPVDDFNGRNKPLYPELIEALARDFIEHGYNLHWLVKAVATSEPYQLTSRSKNREPQAEKYLALARVRPLSPEQIMRSVVEATGADEMAKQFLRGREQMRDRLIAGMTAQFRYAFGDDEGAEVSDFTGSIPSALLMMNSDLVGRGTTAAGFSPFGRLLAKYKSPQDRVRAIFLSTVGRPPTDKETSRWTAHVGRHPGNAGYEDVMWTLLNTSEFLFNH